MTDNESKLPEPMRHLLQNYHDASKMDEKRQAADCLSMSDDETSALAKLTADGRGLESRCILTNDPRSIVFTISEFAIVAGVLGQRDVATDLVRAGTRLRDAIERDEL